MSNQMDSSAVYGMFEEIKKKLDKRPEPTAPVSQTIEIGNIAELKDTAARIEKAAESASKPQEQIHRHRIDLMSNKVLIVLAAVMVSLVVSLWILRNQRQTIRQFRDNDLKYRYIQMKGQAAPADILMLREVFDYNRNPDSIRTIHQRVERYEQLIQQQAEAEARARLNANQTEKIRQEAEAIKGNE